MCWDGAGARLLSGDEQGHVLLSRFENGKIRALKQVVHENSTIVQLRFDRFHQSDGNLILISSLKRVVVARVDGQGSAVQVGRKERKNPAPYGADFGPFSDQPLIYSSRPGLRLWVSNGEGAVGQTLIYKDSVAKPEAKLILLSCPQEYSNNNESLAFGPVFVLEEGLVVTYSSSSLFILNADSSKGVSIVKSSRFANKLRNLSVHESEMFLILDNRMMVRVSDRPSLQIKK